MFKMDEEALKLKLEYFDKEIKLENERITNSKESKLLSEESSNLYRQREDKNRELKKIKKGITLKYVKELDWQYSSWSNRCNFKPNQIKPSVKRGIKKSLSIKSISCVDKFDIKRIVNELIRIDLSKIKSQANNLKKDISEFDEKIKQNSKNQENLRKPIDILCDKRKEIYNKLHKKEFDLEKKRNKISKDFRDIVKNHLPKYIDKISIEVNKELMLDELE